MAKPDYTIRIDDAVPTTFRELCVAAFLVEDIDTKKVEQWLCSTAPTAPAEHLENLPTLTSETLSQVPPIAAWREAYRRQGLKPSRYRSSPEALAKSVLNGRAITTPIPLVNLYNHFSLSFLAPLGGYDLDRLPAPDIVVRHAVPSQDRFTPLGGKAEDMPLTKDVVVYAIDDEVLCWAFNHRDSAQTCLRENSTRAIFCTEAVDGAQRHASLLALNALRDSLASIECRVGDICTVDADNRIASLPFSS